jgi:hypothetical protein
MPQSVNVNNMQPEEMLPPAEKMPAVKSVTKAKKLLKKDKKSALDSLAKCSEDLLFFHYPGGQAAPGGQMYPQAIR